MRKLAIVLTPFLLLVLVIGAVACGGEGAEPTPGPTPTPGPEDTVRAVLSAIGAQDARRMASHFR